MFLSARAFNDTTFYQAPVTRASIDRIRNAIETFGKDDFIINVRVSQ